MFNSNEVTVKFFAESKQVEAFPHPRQAGKFIPSFFQKLKPQSNEHPNSGTVKRCVPFLDSLTHGYIIPMWCDVYVRAYNGDITIEFPDNLAMDSSLSSHGYVQIPDHPLAKRPYGDIPMKWHNPWGVETPKGWSCLFTAPLNHMETRFKILDGIVDTDTYYNQVNFPFIWTGGDGEFFIEAGTPLVQVIPFKRHETRCDVVVRDQERLESVKAQLGTKFRNGYRSLFWHKTQEPE